jgi:hypothetical protein
VIGLVLVAVVANGSQLASWVGSAVGEISDWSEIDSLFWLVYPWKLNVAPTVLAPLYGVPLSGPVVHDDNAIRTAKEPEAETETETTRGMNTLLACGTPCPAILPKPLTWGGMPPRCLRCVGDASLAASSRNAPAGYPG